MSFIPAPELLPSLPPSPVEEDLGWREPWSHSDDDDDDDNDSSRPDDNFQHSKGKAKATEFQPPLPTSYANGGRGEVSQWPDPGRSPEAYPPTTDEATETRRVQEVRVYPVHSSLVPDPLSIVDRT